MDNKFIRKVLESKSLTLEEKTVFVYLLVNESDDNEIVISYTELADALGKSRVTLRRYIKSLEDKGVITLKKNIGNDGGALPNSYILNKELV